MQDNAALQHQHNTTASRANKIGPHIFEPMMIFNILINPDIFVIALKWLKSMIIFNHRNQIFNKTK